MESVDWSRVLAGVNMTVAVVALALSLSIIATSESCNTSAEWATTTGECRDEIVVGTDQCSHPDHRLVPTDDVRCFNNRPQRYYTCLCGGDR